MRRRRNALSGGGRLCSCKSRLCSCESRIIEKKLVLSGGEAADAPAAPLRYLSYHSAFFGRSRRLVQSSKEQTAPSPPGSPDCTTSGRLRTMRAALFIACGFAACRAQFSNSIESSLFQWPGLRAISESATTRANGVRGSRHYPLARPLIDARLGRRSSALPLGRRQGRMCNEIQ